MSYSFLYYRTFHLTRLQHDDRIKKQEVFSWKLSFCKVFRGILFSDSWDTFSRFQTSKLAFQGFSPVFEAVWRACPAPSLLWERWGSRGREFESRHSDQENLFKGSLFSCTNKLWTSIQSLLLIKCSQEVPALTWWAPTPKKLSNYIAWAAGVDRNSTRRLCFYLRSTARRNSLNSRISL